MVSFTSFKQFLAEQEGVSLPVSTISQPDSNIALTPGSHHMMHGFPVFRRDNYDVMKHGRRKGQWKKKWVGSPEEATQLMQAIKKHGGAYIQHPIHNGMVFLNERAAARSLSDLSERLGDYKDAGDYNGFKVLVNIHTMKRVLERNKSDKPLNRVMDHVYRRATKRLLWKPFGEDVTFQPIAIVSKSKVFTGKIVAYYANHPIAGKMLWITTLLSPNMKTSDTKQLVIENEMLSEVDKYIKTLKEVDGFDVKPYSHPLQGVMDDDLQLCPIYDLELYEEDGYEVTKEFVY